ncbi:hypothetical protein V493_00805 [Pseudogymnoascus sp. VKM F-4281 (FW-2241)]|nr:hypothetical protein V493_00805 [Pseudogymnoascus sp. VKM F-4281 (FW-2241)]
MPAGIGKWADGVGLHVTLGGGVSCGWLLSVGRDAQAADGEDAAKRQLILPRAFEAPDDGQGQAEDDKVHDDVEGLVDDEVGGSVDAHSIDRLVPVAAEGPALKRADEEDGGGPEANEPVYEGGDAVEGRGREDATIEADDGDFDGGAKREVGAIVASGQGKEGDVKVMAAGRAAPRKGKGIGTALYSNTPLGGRMASASEGGLAGMVGRCLTSQETGRRRIQTGG